MTSTPDILKKIIHRKCEEIEARQAYRRLSELKSVAENCGPCRGFVKAIENRIAQGDAAVIAEIKKASPSKGVIREDFNPSALAQSYLKGGAACLSVLTDEDFFQGKDEYLQLARGAAFLPAIRKDFIIHEYQVYEARVMRADCILLIAAALDQKQLRRLNRLAHSLGMDVLVEVHNKSELDMALELSNTLIGINNRDLHNFHVTLDTTLNLLAHIPEDRIIVTESGINTREDVELMRNNGVNAFLVGESLMRAEDPGKQLQTLFF